MLRHNKKAQISEFYLVIIALVLAGLVIMSFLTFNANIDIISKKNTESMDQIQFKEQYAKAETWFVLKNALDTCGFCTDSEQLIQAMKDGAKEQEKFANTALAGNLFPRFENYDFQAFLNPKGEYQVEIEGLFVNNQLEGFKVTRNFDLCMIFDRQGNFLNECKIQ